MSDAVSKTATEAAAKAADAAKTVGRAVRKPPIWFYALVVFVTQLDSGSAGTLLSSIVKTYGLTTLSSSWVAGIYTPGLVVGTPIIANLSDTRGTKKVFLWELGFWFVGCLITAVAPVYPLMLAGRFIQAIGDSGIMVLAMNELMQAARKNHQGRRVSFVGVVAGLSAVAGPALAGMAIGMAKNWRVFYYGMLPVLLILFVMAWFVMDNQLAATSTKTDLAGLCSFSVALLTLMLGITLCQHFKQYWVMVLVLIVVAVVAFLLFLYSEKKLDKSTMPFLPISLFRNRSYVLTLVLAMVGGSLFSLFVYIPTYVHAVFHLSKALSGMTMMGTGLGSLIGSYVGGISVIGILLTAHSLPAFFVLSTLFGFGLGAFMSSPLQVIAGRLAAPDQRMQAIGGVSACKKIGMTIAPLVFASAMLVGSVNGNPTLTSFRVMFLVALAIAAVCIVLTLFIPFNKGNIDNDK
ncbi:MAG: MFS transporter [Bifidobacterium sp.]|nr:MFS transporter [Bifidobacterium sp.]